MRGREGTEHDLTDLLMNGVDPNATCGSLMTGEVVSNRNQPTRPSRRVLGNRTKDTTWPKAGADHVQISLAPLQDLINRATPRQNSNQQRDMRIDDGSVQSSPPLIHYSTDKVAIRTLEPNKSDFFELVAPKPWTPTRASPFPSRFVNSE